MADDEQAADEPDRDGPAPAAPTVTPTRPDKRPRRASLHLLKTTHEGLRPLNQAHVEAVGDALRGRRLVSPLVVDLDFEVIDGRHTLAFLQREQQVDPASFAIMCPDGQVPILQRAYRAAEPPTCSCLMPRARPFTSA